MFFSAQLWKKTNFVAKLTSLPPFVVSECVDGVDAAAYDQSLLKLALRVCSLINVEFSQYFCLFWTQKTSIDCEIAFFFILNCEYFLTWFRPKEMESDYWTESQLCVFTSEHIGRLQRSLSKPVKGLSGSVKQHVISTLTACSTVSLLWMLNSQLQMFSFLPSFLLPSTPSC